MNQCSPSLVERPFQRLFSVSCMPANSTSALLERLAGLLGDHLDDSKAANKPVVDYRPAAELREQVDVSLGEEGRDWDELFQDIAAYLTHQVRTAHPQFYNQLWSGVDVAGLLGDFTAAATNTSMYTYEAAPLATLIELELIRKCRELAGFPQGEGSFTTGGSNSNMLALMLARDRSLPDARRHGLQHQPHPLCFFVSDQAHFSFDKAALTLGLGLDALVRVPSDEHGRMEPAELDRLIEASRAEGKQPFFVCATAGTTVLGAFDPLPPIAAVARKHGLWLHVDGSWGGSALLSPNQRHRLAGLQEADSLAWNPHKLMNVSLPCALLLTREPGLLEASCDTGNTEYLYHDYDSADYDLGKRSMHCGRQVFAFKLWLSWRQLGDRGYAQQMDHLVALAQATRERIAAEPNLELQAEPSFLNLCFRYRPADSRLNLNNFNKELRQRLLRSGRAMVNYSYLKNGDLTIRLIIANPESTEASLEEFVSAVLLQGQALEQELVAQG